MWCGTRVTAARRAVGQNEQHKPTYVYIFHHQAGPVHFVASFGVPGVLTRISLSLPGSDRPFLSGPSFALVRCRCSALLTRRVLIAEPATNMGVSKAPGYDSSHESDVQRDADASYISAPSSSLKTGEASYIRDTDDEASSSIANRTQSNVVVGHRLQASKSVLSLAIDEDYVFAGLQGGEILVSLSSLKLTDQGLLDSVQELTMMLLLLSRMVRIRQFISNI